MAEEMLQMYLDYYQLACDPFALTPDPTCLFRSPSHQHALDALTYGVAARQGFILITGARGVGKTTVLGAYLTQSQPTPLTTILLPGVHGTFPELLTVISRACGLETTGATLLEMQTQLQQFLLQEHRHNRNVALFIDDAHRMPHATLEQLWLLTNFDVIADKLVQIVLVGPPELEQGLQQYALRHIAQRITVRTTIVPLTVAESMAYLRQRLATATHPGDRIFARGALKCLARAAHGVPRCLHLLGTQALITGYRVRQQPITARLVRAVIAERTGAPLTPWWPRRVAGGLWRALRTPLRPTGVSESPQSTAPATTLGEC
jgi:type II secretory pathway predicted ATPase ExeA